MEFFLKLAVTLIGVGFIGTMLSIVTDMLLGITINGKYFVYSFLSVFAIGFVMLAVAGLVCLWV